jgi:hypothetical protein
MDTTTYGASHVTTTTRNKTIALRPLRRLSREERLAIKQAANRWSVWRKAVLWCSVAVMIACVVVPAWLQSFLLLGVLLLFGWPIALASIRWAIDKDRHISQQFDELAEQLSDMAMDHGSDIVAECIGDGAR